MRIVQISKWQHTSGWVEGDDENNDDDNVSDYDDCDDETPAEWDL